LSDLKFYKVICEEINLVLLIKKLAMKDEQRAYFGIKRKIQELDKPITIESYMSHVVKNFLHNAEDFFDNLPEDKEDRLTITKAVYQSIIEAYPPFDLSFVCADLNNSTFMDDLLGDQSFAEVIAERLGEGDSKPKGLKAIRTLSDVKGLDKYLSKNLIGQDEAVKGLVDSMKLIASGLYRNASFFFIGPTGVGKTELAKLLGKKYSGKFWKVNCAEYAQQHEYAKLIGSPPGYVGHSEKSLMAEKAEESSRWVILFDEIEKAHNKFYDFLLSLLDDGTCTDNMGRVLDFSESIFIFTSNQGVSDIRVGKKLGFGEERISVSGSKTEIKDSVKKKFPAEFMNRIDNYVFFNTLEPEHLKKIATLSLSNIPIKRHKVLLDYIVEHGYSEEYGARNIKRFIKNEVATVVAQALLERRLPSKKGDLYTPKVVDGKLLLADLMEDNETSVDQAAG
jgi:ATP-dependent Clp protease ATP-binding subunit ClpA